MRSLLQYRSEYKGLDYIFAPYNQIYGICRSKIGNLTIEFQDNTMYCNDEAVQLAITYDHGLCDIHMQCGFFHVKKLFACEFDIEKIIKLILYACGLDTEAIINAQEIECSALGKLNTNNKISRDAFITTIR